MMSYYKEIPIQLNCSFCPGKLFALSYFENLPNSKLPAFRCGTCSVRILITNKSYLPPEVYEYYNFLVKNQLLMKQVWK